MKRWAGQGKGGASLERTTPFSLSPPSTGFRLQALLQIPPYTYAPSFSGAVKEAQCFSHVDTPGARPCSIRRMHGLRYSPSKHVLSAQGLLVREGPSPLQATR